MRKQLRSLSVVIAGVLLSLQGCSISMFSTMFQSPRVFDNVEYNFAVLLATNATHAVHRCDAQKGQEFYVFSQQLNLDSMQLVEYVSNKKEDVGALTSVKQVRTLINGFLQRPDASLKYCIHKLSNVQASARMVARTFGGYTKSSTCFGDVQSRYSLFEDSFKSKAITEPEFKELVTDLLRLESIDKASCTVEAQRDLEQALAFIKTAAKLISSL